MKILMINGSPHKSGCVNLALEEMQKAFSQEGIESEIIYLGTKPIQGCIACGHCYESGKCVFDNDEVNKVIEKLDDCAGLVIGSPVYYSGPSSQIQAFLDRLFYAGGEKMRGKLAASVVSCRRGGASATFERLNQYFLMSDMIVVGSQYWNQIHGNKPEDAAKDKEGLQTMRTLAKNMSWLLKCLEEGKKAGIKEPEYEEWQRTDFIR